MTHEAPIVDPPMVIAAEQDAVVEVGTTAVSPVDQMMRQSASACHDGHEWRTACLSDGEGDRCAGRLAQS